VTSGPAVEGGGGEPSDELVVALDVDLPTFDASAPVYYLAPPLAGTEDAAAFVTDVGEALGLQGQVIQGPDARGRLDVWYADESGAGFRWQPETGWFSYNTFADTSVPFDAITGDNAILIALDWLATIGYPVDQVASSATAAVFGDLWQVSLPDATLPVVGFDFPVGVSIFVSGAGEVTEAQGYWLVLTHQTDATLVSADEAWQAISSKEGYWLDGNQTSEGGEFRVDTLNLTYVLTLDRDDSRLVLQPVVKAEGDYTSPDGLSTSRVAVFVQAVKGNGR
jgi:hypothetical protein